VYIRNLNQPTVFFQRANCLELRLADLLTRKVPKHILVFFFHYPHNHVIVLLIRLIPTLRFHFLSYLKAGMWPPARQVYTTYVSGSAGNKQPSGVQGVLHSKMTHLNWLKVY
jgi:hypothetical protein